MVGEWERERETCSHWPLDILLSVSQLTTLTLINSSSLSLQSSELSWGSFTWQSPTCSPAQWGTSPPPCLGTKPALSFFVSSHWLDRACRRHGSQEPWRRGLRSVLSGPLKWEKMEKIFYNFLLSIYYQESLRPDRCKLQDSEPCQSWCSVEPILTNLCSSRTVWWSPHVHTSWRGSVPRWQ